MFLQDQEYIQSTVFVDRFFLKLVSGEIDTAGNDRSERHLQNFVNSQGTGRANDVKGFILHFSHTIYVLCFRPKQVQYKKNSEPL